MPLASVPHQHFGFGVFSFDAVYVAGAGSITNPESLSRFSGNLHVYRNYW